LWRIFNHGTICGNSATGVSVLPFSVLTAGSAAVASLNLTFAALVTQNTAESQSPYAISIAPLRMTRE
jgi:hypothetical protein